MPIKMKKFDENAEFIPTHLIEEDTEKCKAEWVRFLKKLNAKSNNKDILEHVLENLGDYEDDAVLALLTLHKKEVLDGFGNGVSNLKVKEDKKSQLQQLKVRTRGGDYLTLDECIIIKKGDGDDEDQQQGLVLSELLLHGGFLQSDAARGCDAFCEQSCGHYSTSSDRMQPNANVPQLRKFPLANHENPC